MLLNHQPIVAIVGSRNCSEYGRKYARLFAKELSKVNICIISGLALGIDTAAHDGAISEKGKTIAVLGGGLNKVYPEDNIWLFNKIISEGGCIITEHDNNEETNIKHLPYRNRIISGIADAVLVIEAAHRSGSKITAKYAKEQGKIVYCIPNNLDAKNGVGINELIKDNAKIVVSPNQIIGDLNKEIKELNTTENLKIPQKYNKIYQILKTATTREEIAIKLNKNIEEINSLLTIMEIEGYIKQIAGNSFVRNN